MCYVDEIWNHISMCVEGPTVKVLVRHGTLAYNVMEFTTLLNVMINRENNGNLKKIFIHNNSL